MGVEYPEYPAKPTMVFRIRLQIVLQPFHGLCDLSDELVAQAASLFLVPVSRRSQIGLGSRPDEIRTGKTAGRACRQDKLPAPNKSELIYPNRG